MTNEEKLIEEHLGKQNPFRVPEGYFDSCADRLMQQLPEQQEQEVKPAKTVRMKALRPILVAAACVAVAIFSITLYFHQTQETPEQNNVAAVTSNTDEEYLDEAADYVMLDNADIYACLSE